MFRLFLRNDNFFISLKDLFRSSIICFFLNDTFSRKFCSFKKLCPSLGPEQILPSLIYLTEASADEIQNIDF